MLETWRRVKQLKESSNYKFVKGDIADREFIFDLFEREAFDMVVNFAAESHVDPFSRQIPKSSCKTNVLGTQVLMRCFTYIMASERYHQVSTDEVYGDLPLRSSGLTSLQKILLYTLQAPTQRLKPRLTY